MAPLKGVGRAQTHTGGGRIHGWEVMAPLKGVGRAQTHTGGGRIHGWEVMAPLKAIVMQKAAQLPVSYPWLRGHGSIEGALYAAVAGLWMACIHG